MLSCMLTHKFKKKKYIIIILIMWGWSPLLAKGPWHMHIVYPGFLLAIYDMRKGRGFWKHTVALLPPVYFWASPKISV